jgi:hypothetical protein
MLQSFSGPTFREAFKRKTPPGLRRRGFGIVCCSSPYGALPTTTTTRTTTTAAGSAVFSRVEVFMDEVIGDLCLESLIEFIQTQVFGVTMEIFSSAQKCVKDHVSFVE